MIGKKGLVINTPLYLPPKGDDQFVLPCNYDKRTAQIPPLKGEGGCIMTTYYDLK